MNSFRPIAIPELIEPKLVRLGSGRIVVSAMLALSAILTGCAQPAQERREVFMDTRGEVLVATEGEEVVRVAGWPWVDTNATLAQAADAGGAASGAE